MKKLFLYTVFLISLLMIFRTAANPVAVYWINEFGIDSTGWKIELHSNQWQDSLSLNGWFLTSNEDTAFFKNGIYFNSADYYVITDDDLQSDLEINLDGDEITLYNSDSEFVFYLDRISFGRDISIYPVSTPPPGSSICFGDLYGDNSRSCYIDKSPTFGFENDYTGIDGGVEGYIKDLFGNPISGVKVSDNLLRDMFVDNFLTDSTGYFKLVNYACIVSLHFEKDNFIDSIITLQVWPDSTIQLPDITLITGIIEKIPSNIVNDFNLSQNFPNPFNNSTTFFYTLPKGDNVEVTIYDEKGALVQKLFSGYQSAGEYRVNWKADNLASGVYIYHIKTGTFKISKKAVLLK